MCCMCLRVHTRPSTSHVRLVKKPRWAQACSLRSLQAELIPCGPQTRRMSQLPPAFQLFLHTTRRFLQATSTLRCLLSFWHHIERAPYLAFLPTVLVLSVYTRLMCPAHTISVMCVWQESLIRAKRELSERMNHSTTAPLIGSSVWSRKSSTKANVILPSPTSPVVQRGLRKLSALPPSQNSSNATFLPSDHTLVQDPDHFLDYVDITVLPCFCKNYSTRDPRTCQTLSSRTFTICF